MLLKRLDTFELLLLVILTITILFISSFLIFYLFVSRKLSATNNQFNKLNIKLKILKRKCDYVYLQNEDNKDNLALVSKFNSKIMDLENELKNYYFRLNNHHKIFSFKVFKGFRFLNEFNKLKRKIENVSADISNNFSLIINEISDFNNLIYKNKKTLSLTKEFIFNNKLLKNGDFNQKINSFLSYISTIEQEKKSIKIKSKNLKGFELKVNELLKEIDWYSNVEEFIFKTFIEKIEFEIKDLENDSEQFSSLICDLLNLKNKIINQKDNWKKADFLENKEFFKNTVNEFNQIKTSILNAKFKRSELLKLDWNSSFKEINFNIKQFQNSIKSTKLTEKHQEKLELINSSLINLEKLNQEILVAKQETNSDFLLNLYKKAYKIIENLKQLLISFND